jgi:hypothetical protein
MKFQTRLVARNERSVDGREKGIEISSGGQSGF